MSGCRASRPRLVPERRRGEDQDAADPAAEQQFGEDQTGLDGLAEAHIVRDQQVHPRHPQRLAEGGQLVVLDPHPAVERTRRRSAGRAVAGPVRVEVRRKRGPPRGPEEGVELRRRHRRPRRVGERVRLEELPMAAGFSLPEQALLLREVVVEVLQMDEAQRPARPGLVGLDPGDHPAPVPHRRQHPDPRRVGRSGGRGGHGEVAGRITEKRYAILRLSSKPRWAGGARISLPASPPPSGRSVGSKPESAVLGGRLSVSCYTIE